MILFVSYIVHRFLLGNRIYISDEVIIGRLKRINSEKTVYGFHFVSLEKTPNRRREEAILAVELEKCAMV